MMATEACLICREALSGTNDGIGSQCNACGALMNISTRVLDYMNGKGQSPPDRDKSHWRLVNARRRMAIIAPFLAGHAAFIDIGCGSGETLLAAREVLPTSQEHEINEPLVRFGRSTKGVGIEQSLLFSFPSPCHQAERAGFTIRASGNRIFARSSHSGSSRFRLLRERPHEFLRALVRKPRMLSIADVMIADYGHVVLGA